MEEVVHEEQAAETQPPKYTVIRPAALNVVKLPDGGAQFDFLVTPFEIIGVALPADTVQEILRTLTGGIELARSLPRMDVPQGRGR